MEIIKGTPADTDMWAGLYWFADHEESLAVRQKRSDGLWYITVRTTSATMVVHGPCQTLDAAVMLVEMGAVEL